MNIEELKALAEKASSGDWEHFILDKPLSEIPAYVETCINSSGGGQDFHFVTGTHPDGNPADICHVGNGVKSEHNAAFIAAANPAAILALITDLESTQDERRALLATEQNLRERVKALEECVSMFLEADVYADGEGIVQIAHADTASCISAVNIARALLEKTT